MREELESLRTELKRTKEFMTASTTPVETVEYVESSTATDLVSNDLCSMLTTIPKIIHIEYTILSTLLVLENMTTK